MKLLKDPFYWWIFAMFLLGFVIPAIGITRANDVQNTFQEQCKEKGGKTIVLRRDSLCVDPDGRILGDL